jgi:hypothetical protein
LNGIHEGSFNLAFAASFENNHLLSDRTTRRLHLAGLSFGILIVWVHDHCDQRGVGNQLAQQLQTLWLQRGGELGHTRKVAAWPVEACDQAEANRITAG